MNYVCPLGYTLPDKVRQPEQAYIAVCSLKYIYLGGIFMRIAIVDDSLSDIQYLYENIRKYCQEHQVHMTIEPFHDESRFLSSLKEHSYDLVILDI